MQDQETKAFAEQTCQISAFKSSLYSMQRQKWVLFLP